MSKEITEAKGGDMADNNNKRKHLVTPFDSFFKTIEEEQNDTTEADNQDQATSQVVAANTCEPDSDPANDPNLAGVKLDDDKPLAECVLSGFGAALSQVIEVGTFGAKKYTPDGWKTVDDGIRRYKEAAARHQLAIWRGEKIDEESGLPHRAHLAWNQLAILSLEDLQQ